MSDYPEHDKLTALDGKNNAVGDFLTWLGEHGYEICQLDRLGRFQPVMRPTREWIANHFDIDEGALEREKRQMLAVLVEASRPEKQGAA